MAPGFFMPRGRFVGDVGSVEALFTENAAHIHG